LDARRKGDSDTVMGYILRDHRLRVSPAKGRSHLTTPWPIPNIRGLEPKVCPLMPGRFM
jgi:hypothetical protein